MTFKMTYKRMSVRATQSVGTCCQKGGVLLMNVNWFDKQTQAHREFVLEHEYGHWLRARLALRAGHSKAQQVLKSTPQRDLVNEEINEHIEHMLDAFEVSGI